eukprot:12409982-Karenia_brevis.AAC.1
MRDGWAEAMCGAIVKLDAKRCASLNVISFNAAIPACEKGGQVRCVVPLLHEIQRSGPVA